MDIGMIGMIFTFLMSVAYNVYQSLRHARDQRTKEALAERVCELQNLYNRAKRDVARSVTICKDDMDYVMKTPTNDARF